MTTRHKGNEIAKPITPLSETASEEDSDHEQAQRDKDMQKNLALIAKYFKKIYKPTNNNLRTSSNSKNKNVDTTQRYKNDDHSGQFGTQRTVNVTGTREKVGSQVVQKTGIQCFNCKEYGHFAKECRKPKRVKDSAYHKEKMLLCKQAEQGVSLQAEQYDCYIAKIQEAPNADSGTNSEPVEQTEFEKYKAFNDRTIDYDKLERKLTEALDLFRAPTALDMEILIQTCLMPLAIKTQSDSLKFVHELKQEMHADLNKKDHTELLQHFAKVEKHSTSLELALQKCKEQIIQLILFIVDSGCTKNMTGNLKLLYNFVEKFMGTVRFGNDQFAPILGYGDLVQGNVTINKGNDLLTINRGSDLYTISLQESTSSTPLCLMAKATPTQAWLWQRRLSHLNFDYINLVSMKDIVIGLPKLKYVKDQLCSSCELSKA
nr:hypothetical protein [Tanacetum cinerariifolium]